MAGVQSIQIAPLSPIPASPAVLPSGTVKYMQKPSSASLGIASTGSTPYPSTTSLWSSRRRLEATSKAASSVISCINLDPFIKSVGVLSFPGH